MGGERDDKISKRAYEIWESEGRQPGRDQDHWFRAQSEIGSGDIAPGGGAAGTRRATASKTSGAGRSPVPPAGEAGKRRRAPKPKL
jgi:hypothetical protein